MKKFGKKILITGGAGYIGQNLISFFLKDNYNIYVIDNLSTSKPINHNIKKCINFYKIDLTKEKMVKNFFKEKNFDLIIHLAAISGIREFNKNSSKNFNNNVLATKNLIRYGFENNSIRYALVRKIWIYDR